VGQIGRSLYIHIPFCRSKCVYCDFLSFANVNDEQMHTYVRLLIEEIRLYTGERLNTLYIGGGTPSLLPPVEMEKLLKCVAENFITEPIVEFTVEANPETLTRTMLALWSAYGVNRVSLGVQSFDDEVLTKMGRSSRYSDIQKAIELMKTENISNFNLDLMLGISGARVFRDDLRKATAAAATHISVYMLGVSAGTKISEMVRRGGFCELSGEVQELLYIDAERLLAENGYMRYEISNFAKSGFESQHNLNYWEGGEYIGVGLGAVTTLGLRRTVNSCSFAAYQQMLDRGEKPISSVEQLTPEQKRRERVMLMLRTRRGLPLDELAGMAPNTRVDELEEFIRILRESGLALQSETDLILTSSGLLRSNLIISEIWGFIATTNNYKEFEPESRGTF
jgi:oxygen-independent coproporphyrinogen-3 oxidase